MNHLPPVYFYIPQDKFSIQSAPHNAEAFWKWLCQHDAISPMASGGFLWTMQTYLKLNDSGFPCQLVDYLPDEGIIIAHRDFFEHSLKPNPRQLLVCLRADVNRHPYAQLHVVQNPHQSIPKKLFSLWQSCFIPHWPQPDIVPRRSDRGDRFENVVFAGNQVNLVSELRQPQWYRQLEELGLKFQQQLSHEDWNHYEDTDVILAIRKFGTADEWNGKPGSKLYNAWLAETPIILGYESAFRAERKSELDFLEATSYEEVITALKRLRDNPDLRRKMVANGKIRAQEVSTEQMVQQWQSFIENEAVPAYQQWCGLPRWQQQAFIKLRYLFTNSRPAYYWLKSKVRKLKSA